FDDDPLMARLRQAFSAEHALQCGYCTPGMLVAARDLVRRKGGLSRAEIRTEMSGNLCRCTGYVGIVSAIESVMAERASLVTEPAPAVAGWLGPAPGPKAASAVAKPVAAQVSERATPSLPAPSTQVRPRAQPIEVTVGPIEDRDGATCILQSFVLPHPLDAVWQLMADPEAVARSMPGMSLDGPPQGGKLKGRLEVKIGPISASFAGEGALQQIASEHRQIIEGRGGDRKSGSRVSGSVDYRLEKVAGASGSEATRVDVAMSYVLTGPLAQIGRSGIVRDLVRRIGAAFAQNLDAQLRDPTADLPATSLGGLSLITRVLADRLRTLLARLLGR
ncbi:MAG TPA: 2Fe-2S iron-sulfur cluster-binding protein, partial [Hyphomicrobiaceae bacterium]|nr:2Fe-2S iron-sulfur cluster-binding protein [Hyphomicrobiaceae bacterium]